jgi:pimeloyl-ACP methyl ester carboxylesterase
VSKSDLSHVVAGKTGYAESNGVRIWYESISPQGTPKGVVLLSIAMAGDSLFWPPKFIRALTGAGYKVLRYDQRGTGLSDWMEDWHSKHPYTITDMAEDAVAVLDELGIEKSHMVGLSLGGMVAQEIAIAHPDRTLSLTLLSTSPNVADSELPSLATSYIVGSLFKGLPLLKYRLMGGEKNLVKERIAKTISVNVYEGLGIKELAELVLYDLRERRGINLKALVQHQAAAASTRSRYELLKTLTAPTLIIHGTSDQILPITHGEKLAELIPNAKNLWLEGVGHRFPYPNMDDVNETIVFHMDSVK